MSSDPQYLVRVTSTYTPKPVPVSKTLSLRVKKLQKWLNEPGNLEILEQHALKKLQKVAGELLQAPASNRLRVDVPSIGRFEVPVALRPYRLEPGEAPRLEEIGFAGNMQAPYYHDAEISQMPTPWID